MGRAESGTVFSFLKRSGCLDRISRLVFTASEAASVTASVCTCVFLSRCLSVCLRVLAESLITPVGVGPSVSVGGLLRKMALASTCVSSSASKHG